MKKISALALAILCFANALHAQKVGINVPLPTENLHVDSVIKVGKNSFLGLSTPGRKNLLKFGDGDYVTIGEEITDDKLFIRFGDLVFLQSVGSSGSGYIGIGTPTPTAFLDLDGTLRIRSGIAGIGKVLTSDANGNATWQTPSPGFTLPYSSSDGSNGTSFIIANNNGAANAISGQSFGSGIGVQGFTSGGKGIFGSANTGIGVDAYSNSGTAGVFSSNSGLAIKTTTGNVEINGKIKIIDGTQGIGKVLTSDGGGLASWGTAPGSPSFTASKISGNQILASGNNYLKVNFSSASTIGIGYTTVNSDYTVTTGGMYHFDVCLSFANHTLAATTNNSIFISLYKRTSSSGYPIYNFEFAHTQPLNSRCFSATVYLDAGDIIDVRVLNQSGIAITVEANPVSNYSFWGGYRVN